MNENRSVFGLNGIAGMLIATVLLLTILVGLTVWAMAVQNENSTNFYKIVNAKDIKSGIGGNGSARADHIVDVK